MNPQLIIFDCDGVLVDSEKISNAIIAEELTNLGLPMTYELTLQTFAGGAFSKINDYFLAQTGQSLPADFETNYRRLTQARYAEDLEAIEGVEQVLQTLKHKKCVGSNGPLFKIKLNLETTNLTSYFGGRLYSAYEIKRWKPEPDLYWHAARENDVAPEDCLVIEDSILGVQAAVAAGIPVLAYTGTNDSQKLAEAGATTFDHMLDLLDLIEQK